MFLRQLTKTVACLASFTIADPATVTAEGIQSAPPIYEGLLPHIRIEGAPVQPSTLKERLQHHKIPGVSIAFLKDGKILWTHTEGVTDFKTNQPINENTVFQAGSISKPVFATTLMLYRQKHGLNIDTDINSHLKSWQLPNHEWQQVSAVTVRRLLSHTAGTTVHGFPGYASDQKMPSLVSVLRGENPANNPAIVVDAEPGTMYRYSGGGTSVAQLVLEDVSGHKLPQLAQSLVFEPLSMDHTVYAQPLIKELASNAAVPHDNSGKPIDGGAHTYAAMAAAGLWTTPSDILRLANGVIEARAGESKNWLDQASAAEMLTPIRRRSALGFFVNDERASFAHGGANAGFRAYFLAHSDTRDGIALMINSNNGEALRREILNRLSEIYGWEEYRPTIRTTMPFSDLIQNSLIGTYKISEPIQAELFITADGENIQVNMPGYIDEVPFYFESEDKIFSLTGIDIDVKRRENGVVEKLEFWGGEAIKLEIEE